MHKDTLTLKDAFNNAVLYPALGVSAIVGTVMGITTTSFKVGLLAGAVLIPYFGTVLGLSIALEVISVAGAVFTAMAKDYTKQKNSLDGEKSFKKYMSSEKFENKLKKWSKSSKQQLAAFALMGVCFFTSMSIVDAGIKAVLPDNIKEKIETQHNTSQEQVSYQYIKSLI